MCCNRAFIYFISLAYLKVPTVHIDGMADKAKYFCKNLHSSFEVTKASAVKSSLECTALSQKFSTFSSLRYGFFEVTEEQTRKTSPLEFVKHLCCHTIQRGLFLERDF